MLIKLMKFIFTRLVGVDQIPKKNRERFWAHSEQVLTKLATAYIEGQEKKFMVKFTKEF